MALRQEPGHQSPSSGAKAAKRALRDHDPLLVHEWRKKTKRLLYEIQLTQRRPKQRIAGCLKKVDKLQELLGDFQDSMVTENHLRRHPLPEIDATDHAQTIRLLKKSRKLLLKKARSCWRSILDNL